MAHENAVYESELLAIKLGQARLRRELHDAAVVGLRALYQLLSVAVSDLIYLETAVAVVLGFVGVKLGLDRRYCCANDTCACHHLPERWHIDLFGRLCWFFVSCTIGSQVGWCLDQLGFGL